MTAEGLGWDSEMQTATAWETQESGAGGRLGDKAAGGGDTRKGTSADANKTGAGGRHGERPELRGRITGWRENPAGKSSGVRGDRWGREASRVDHESLGVGDKEGGREDSGVAENPRGYPQGVGRGSRVAAGHRHPRSDRVSQRRLNPWSDQHG